jgi:hypothetical protein
METGADVESKAQRPHVQGKKRKRSPSPAPAVSKAAKAERSVMFVGKFTRATHAELEKKLPAGVKVRLGLRHSCSFLSFFFPCRLSRKWTTHRLLSLLREI